MSHTKEFQAVSNQLELILEVGQAFNSVIDVDRLLALIADRTRKLLEAERCSIFVVNIDEQVLWTQAATGSDRIEIPINSGIAGAVAMTGDIVNIPDAYADLRFNPEVDRKSGFRTRHILCGPMYNSKGETIGVFQLLNSLAGGFKKIDEKLLSALSGFAGNALENALLYDELKTTFLSVLEVLAATVDAKHPYTAGHTARVAEYSIGIAREMGLSDDDVERIKIAAYLHDYGKIGIRDAVLTKPGRLSDEEFVEMRSHAEKTRQLLTRMHFSRQNRAVPSIAGAHHEKFDGSGYPLGLSGNNIPLGARIMAIADVFDALTSDRDYRTAMPYQECLEMLRGDAGTHFDPIVFRYFEMYYKKRFADK